MPSIKSILVIAGIALGAVFLWNKFVAPKTGAPSV
jgi:hypothetical protein